MRKLIVLITGLVIGGIVSAWVVMRISAGDAEHALAQKQAAWEKEKVALESALLAAKNKRADVRTIVQQEQIEVTKEMSPEEIVASLETLRIKSGETKTPREIIYHLELLIRSGEAALPAIREFLARNEEIDYDSPLTSWKGAKDGKAQTQFFFPPSLRFGLLDAARQIGGADAEKLLADVLSETGRGAEVGYLARALQEIAPDKYRELALSVARELLTNPTSVRTGGLDKYDREYLYGVLTFFNDPSFSLTAQSQLVRADGAIDRGALKYLQQTVGAQALSSIEQAYADANIDPTKKEPLIRYALGLAGADAQATALWRKGLNDSNLSFDQRRELIEDLNQDGIQNGKNPTARDAEIIAKRLELINAFRSDNDHKILQAAWDEAQKDLRNMLANFAKNSTP